MNLKPGSPVRRAALPGYVMTAISFRFATDADVGTLHALVESAYRGESAKTGWTDEADLLDGQRTDPESLVEIIIDPAQRIILAIEDDALVGCVQIGGKGAGLAYLGLLSVDPGRQAGGLGSLLIAEAEATAARLFSARRVEMTVIRQRPELIAFYQRRGYSLTGELRPFPYDDERFGQPLVDDLVFVVLARDIG